MEISEPLELIPAKPAGTIDQIFEIDCVADAETRQKHVDSAVARNLPRVINRKRRRGKVAIVASGPSVTEYVDELKAWDGEIWGINRAFEWMRHRGVKPTGFIGVDPEWFLVECLPNIPEDATYYLAAQVHPCVFDHLKERNVRLWFMADSQVKMPWGACQVYGGSTCLSRAPNLAYMLGYREVHVFGGDSSFTHKTHVHGGDLPPNWVPAEVDGVVYKTTRAMMSQATEFVEQMVEWAKGKDPLSVSIHGDGLMPALVGQAMNSGNYERYLREQLLADVGR
jgi:hypothetical protein